MADLQPSNATCSKRTVDNIEGGLSQQKAGPSKQRRKTIQPSVEELLGISSPVQPKKDSLINSTSKADRRRNTVGGSDVLAQVVALSGTGHTQAQDSISSLDHLQRKEPKLTEVIEHTVPMSGNENVERDDDHTTSIELGRLQKENQKLRNQLVRSSSQLMRAQAQSVLLQSQATQLRAELSMSLRYRQELTEGHQDGDEGEDTNVTIDDYNEACFMLKQQRLLIRHLRVQLARNQISRKEL